MTVSPMLMTEMLADEHRRGLEATARRRDRRRESSRSHPLLSRWLRNHAA
jgi:hypothetical protein